MATAKGQGDAPPMLELSWLCGPYNLPAEGGALDQDYRTMQLMSAARKAHDTVDRTRGLKGEAIHNMSAGDQKTIAYLRRIKVM